VVIVAGDIVDHNLSILEADGWRIYRTEAINNPSLWTQNGGHGFPQKFWGVYTKLMIFNLKQQNGELYKRVVYLDADTVAARNIDELFLCDAALCGVLRHSERFNSGVMVLEPSEQTLQDMLQHISTVPSYTGGDQGFLNEYFSEFANSPLFDPSTSFGNTFSQQVQNSSSSSSWKDSKGRMIARLPTIYNADLGLYVANSNRWTLPREKIGVVHFTLGAFKPWQWYSSWILSENGRYWQSLRSELPVYKQGKEGGLVVMEEGERSQTMGLPLSAFEIFTFLGPWLLSILMVRRWCWKQGLENCLKCWIGCYGTRGKQSKTNNSSVILAPRTLSSRVSPVTIGTTSSTKPAYSTPFFGFSALSALAGFASLGSAFYIAVVLIIPIQIEPMLGWILAYEWITFLTLFSFGTYVALCYKLGQRMQGMHGVSPGSPRSTSAVAAIVPSSTPPSLSPRYVSSYSSKKEDGEVVFVCGRRPWGESLVVIGVLIATLGLLPWWTDILG
jgi:inositol phosphorylceramide glucuronosyltransferase 1